MPHEHDLPDLDVMFTQEFWDQRYGSTDALWSGQPNQRLVEIVADRPPGTALDAGCGEGADAIWLAERGWQVTGVDVSELALERAAQHAEAAGADVAARITWQHADLLYWAPAAAGFDLVSSHYLHLPPALREVVYGRFAAAVRPGGMLLIVGHHPSDLQTTVPRPNLPELLFTAEQEAARLDPHEWTVVASAPQREAVDPDGNPVMITDAVLRAERKSLT